MIDQHTIAKITDAANIVEVVSDFVTLRRRGVNHVGLCPFHQDTKPSFYVSPAKNICKCFACNEGGTPLHFIMKHEQLTYVEALKYLAKKYNIEIEEKELSPEQRKARGERESMFIVNQWAQQYFSDTLHNHPDGKNIGMNYFVSRGFTETVIRKFQLGYSLDMRDALTREASNKGYQKEYLAKTGLAIAYDDGRTIDRFRARVMFPVHTVSGKVVAFGGRTLSSDKKIAKYINSPESEIYHKSNELYGLFFAKQAIVKQGKCLIVEGYTDVISLHQSGIENVVSSSGTALTTGQIRLVRRFTNNVTVIYDGDAAGIKAAIRGIDMLLEEGINVKVVLLPEGEDPDSFAKAHNATQLAQYISDNETDFIKFKTNLLLEQTSSDPIKRSLLIQEIIKSVAVIPDAIARSVYIKECSEMMQIAESVLINEIKKIRESKPSAHAPSQPRPSTHPHPQQATPSTATLPPNFPPPLADESHLTHPDQQPAPPPANEDFATPSNPNLAKKRNQYEPYETALAKYIVRYGERVLYDYIDEEDQKQIVYRVADYIVFDLERDGITFQNPTINKIATQAAKLCTTDNFIAEKYFLSHPDQDISLMTVDLVSEKYQLSKIHTKYKDVESIEDRLEQCIVQDLFALKDVYIMQEISGVQQEIRKAQQQGNFDEVMTQMKNLSELNNIKKMLSKELGERIILNPRKN